jgi:Chlorite dismutase
MAQRLFCFSGGETGGWRVERMQTLAGEPLASVARIDVIAGYGAPSPGGVWRLRGVTSNERYVTGGEKARLLAKQPGLGRPEASCAALIPIRKSDLWWAMPQDERRRIFEEQSTHIATGLKYLPAVARRLHHCRDLGTAEPFDFLTWFEFAPGHAAAFGELLAELRASPEWRYVDREIELRLVRDDDETHPTPEM